MGDGGAAVIAEVAMVKSEVAEFRSEVKKDLKVRTRALLVKADCLAFLLHVCIAGS